MKSLTKITNALVAAALLVVGLGSCDKVDYPDRHEVTSGLPEVYSIRYAGEDIYITSAYMDEIVCLLGDNLTSVTEIWFNDQQAILNTSYVTANTLIVSVPSNMPTVTTNKIYLMNKDRRDTVAVDFQVLPPVPRVNSMSNEWAAPGEEATIYGSFFFPNDETPLEISFPGATVSQSDITFNGSTEMTFTVPEGANPGYVTVSTISGAARSKFQYKDTRNILFDWDGSHGGHASGYGWRAGVVHTPGTDSWAEAVDGSYLYFGGAELAASGETWAEDNFSFNYWPGNVGHDYPPLSSREEFAEYIDAYGTGGLQMKFEMCVSSANPWSACAMQIIFTSLEEVSADNMNNSFYGSTDTPRALYIPWRDSGSFDTGNKWITVTIPLTDFNLCNDGSACAKAFSEDRLAGLNIFVWHGAVAGTDCSPEILIDNIRVVPIE